MTSEATDLTPVWEAITTWLNQAGIPIYPAVPHDEYSGVEAYWPGASPDNWAAFLDLARAVQVPVMYARAGALGRSERTETQTSAPGSVEYWFPSFADEHPELIGDIGLLELAYAIGPVIHRWTLEAAWWQDAQQQFDDLADHDDEMAAVRADEPHYETWTPEGRQQIRDALGGEIIDAAVMRLASDRRFLAARTGYERRNLVDAGLDEELHSWRTNYRHTSGHEDPVAYARYRAIDYVLDLAAQEADAKRAAAVADALNKIAAWAVELGRRDDYRAATLANARKRRVQGFIEEKLGFRSPDVFDALYGATEKLRKQPDAPSMLE